MIISITESLLKNRELSFSGELALPPTVTDRPDSHFEKDAVVTGSYVCTKDSLRFDGKISLSLSCPCDRCLSPLVIPMEIPFREEFVQNSADPEVFGFTGDVVDLTEAVIETVALALPGKAVCSESCKGLCPSCGADLNAVSCNCSDAPDPGSKFSELLNLFK